MQKTSFPSLQVFFLGLLIFPILYACKKKPKATSVADVSSYIYAYTSGVISKTSPIRVKFTRDVVDTDQVGTTVLPTVFTLDPFVEGVATWEDSKTLLFKPSTSFTSGKSYQATLALRQLIKEAKGKSSQFIFDFSARPLQLSLIHI